MFCPLEDLLAKKYDNKKGEPPYKEIFVYCDKLERNWRTNTLRPVNYLRGHDDHVVTCLQFDGVRIVSASDDNTLKVWSAKTGTLIRTLVGHTGLLVFCIAFYDHSDLNLSYYNCFIDFLGCVLLFRISVI